MQLSHTSTMSPWYLSFASRRRQTQIDCSSSVWRELMKRNSSFAKPLAGLWGTTPEQTRVQLKTLWRPTELLYQPWASEKLSSIAKTFIYLAHMHYFCKTYKLGVSHMSHSILYKFQPTKFLFYMWLLHKMPFPMHVKEILMWDLKFYTLHCVQCLSWWQWYFVHCQCSSLVSITTSFWRGGSGAKLPSTFCTTDLRGKTISTIVTPKFVCIAPPDPWMELW